MARLKINPGLRMVEFAAGSVQFGLGAGGLVLEGYREVGLGILRRLRQGLMPPSWTPCAPAAALRR